jgi:hypothetical protein
LFDEITILNDESFTTTIFRILEIRADPYNLTKFQIYLGSVWHLIELLSYSFCYISRHFEYGQRRPQHQRVPVFHLHGQDLLVGRQARGLRTGRRRNGYRQKG